MNEYEIEQDILKSDSRSEKSDQGGDRAGHHKINAEGTVQAVQTHAMCGRGSEPIHWRNEGGGLPPGLAAMIPPGTDVSPKTAQSKTWNAYPNPWIFNVTWKTGGVNEFYRLTNAVFTVFSYASATGQQGIATYAATITPSGVGKSLSAQQFNANLLTSSGGLIEQLKPQTITIACGEPSHSFAWQWQFEAGLYDLIGGAHFTVSEGEQINRC